MQRVTLAAGPRAARPDHVVARDFLCDFRDCLVVTQRVQVVFEPAAHSRMVLPVYRRAFTEVDLDRADAELQKISQFSLVPLDCLWITHVERRILERKLTTF